jgi:copper(I)-binding protein
MKVSSLILIILLMTPLEALQAQEVKKAWMRKPNPVVPMTAAFMEIHNSEDKDIYLIKVTGEDAENYEIHTHKKVEGVMKMRQIKKLKVPAKGMAILKPMSDHVMIMQIKKGHLKGEKAELNLHFDNGKSVKVVTPIKKK